MAVSEVAQLRERIANEYMAAQWGLSGLAYGTAKHEFITKRMECMEEHREELAEMVGQDQATIMLAETLAALPEHPERHAVLAVIKHMRGESEHTAHMLDWIQDVWETLDILLQEFGEEDTRKILSASRVPSIQAIVAGSQTIRRAMGQEKPSPQRSGWEPAHHRG